MIRHRISGFLCVVLTVSATCHARPSQIEPPSLAERVLAGELPPLSGRLPIHPNVLTNLHAEWTPGRYGGELRTLAGRSKDVRLMVVYGYARLVGYDQNYRLVPDILENIEVAEGRSFTLHLREGHRWSDGRRFTSEDFRYYWEDVATHGELSTFGPPAALLVNGEAPHFEVLSESAVRYTWSKPNPFFLPALAAARPETIYAPAHYLKQFHARYSDPERLATLARTERRRNWVAVHFDRFKPYRNTNPELPTLQPWINTTRQPAPRFVFVRNPFFHRVDGEGRQLPYIDRVVMDVVDPKLIPIKAGAGDSDLQARGLNFGDYAFVKQSERRGRIRLLLWDTTKGANIALYPNLNVVDPVWRTIVRDVRFRRALSLATDRDEINQVFFFGLARPGNDTVVPASPLFHPEYRYVWAEYDLDEANALLDELGLKRRKRKGIRQLPDGRPMEIIVETAGENPEEVDILQLIAATWRKVGVKLFTKPIQREVFRNRIYAGKTVMSVWGGLENGLPTPDMSPRELAPTRQDQYQWPKWGQFYETGTDVGEPPSLPEAQELLKLNERWLVQPSTRGRARVWHRMLEIRADQVFTIGIVSGVPQPVVVNDRLRNVPTEGIYNWDPGAHFGIYSPDTFWFAEE
jgi:peptide/nickel transport system substrate-binding protein